MIGTHLLQEALRRVKLVAGVGLLLLVTAHCTNDENYTVDRKLHGRKRRE